jgi:CBS domain-containing protein
MHPGIVSCSDTASAREIAQIMSSCRVHSVVVVGVSSDERHDPVVRGMISDLDLLAAATDPDRPATAATLVRQPAVSVPSTASVHDAARTMVDGGVTHVVVVDSAARAPLGILSTLDIADLLACGVRG